MSRGIVLQDRYLVEGIVGVGGMGAVYKARDMRFNVVKTIAVKEMVNQARDALVRDTIVKNFEREANILATLNHPSIPTIYDYFSQESKSYLVMDLIDGKNLETILNEQSTYFEEDQVIAWAIELCDVLSYLHNHPSDQIIFRDMKPANVMINQNNHVVLVDFGIAKIFQAGQKGTMIGTEGYSPPEQYRGEASPQVDIYALGATLHHLLTRKDPRIEAPFTFSERPIREINENVSIELETVVYSALQYNPLDRFQTAQDMKEALIAVARKTGILTSPDSHTARIAKPQAIQPFWEFECEDEIRGTPTYHEGVLYVGAYDNNLYSLNAATGEFIWKYATEGGIVSQPVVYEKNIYFGSEDHKLHVISTSSGRVIWTYYTEGPIRSSPNVIDRHVFIGSDDGHLHVINAGNGRRVLRVDAGAAVRSSPLVKNEHIFFGTESGDFWCVDFRGNVRWRYKAKRAVTSSAIMVEDILYFTSMDSTLYAIDSKTGWVIWRFRMGKGSISTPAHFDNLIYAGSADTNIYAVDIRNGKSVWQYTAEHQVNATPTIHKNMLYCGSIDGNLYCIDAKTGRLNWSFATDGPITSTPIIHEDVVFLSSFDHKIYALPA